MWWIAARILGLLERQGINLAQRFEQCIAMTLMSEFNGALPFLACVLVRDRYESRCRGHW